MSDEDGMSNAKEFFELAETALNEPLPDHEVGGVDDYIRAACNMAENLLQMKRKHIAVSMTMGAASLLASLGVEKETALKLFDKAMDSASDAVIAVGKNN